MTLLHFYSLFRLKHFTYVKLDENELFCSFWVPIKKKKKETQWCGAGFSKEAFFGSHGIRTLKAVTSHPLSRAHLTSSEAKTWQMRMKWSVPNVATVISFKNTFLSWNLFCQSIIDCSSALHLGLPHLTWLRLTMAADVKLMTGLASVWEFD